MFDKVGEGILKVDETVAFTVNGADESFITRAGMLIEEYNALVNPDWEKAINKAYFE